jgi:hypothetical protein
MVSKNVTVPPEILPSNTLDVVALDGIANLPCNRYAEAATLMIAPANVRNKASVLKPFSLFGKTQKIRSMQQPIILGKSLLCADNFPLPFS